MPAVREYLVTRLSTESAPVVVNTDGRHHVISSGLYTLANSAHANNLSTMFAASAISSIPLLLLFVYATRPFIRGLTAGAF